MRLSVVLVLLLLLTGCIGGTSVQNPVINPSETSFDRTDGGEDVSVSILWGSAKIITSITRDSQALVPETDYHVVGTTLIVAKDYLIDLELDEINLVISFDKGSKRNLTIISGFFGDSPFAGGLGTESNPYQVATAAQLDAVRDYLDCHFIQTADIDLSDYQEDGGWKAIGDGYYNYSTRNPFSGTYDGNGKSITGLSMDYSGEFQDENVYLGLFGNTSTAALLKNINLIDVDVAAWTYVGGLVGANEGTVQDCTVSGNVVGIQSMIGGLVGFNRGIVTGCTSSAGFPLVDETQAYVGGLVGYNEANAEISDSSYHGEINVTAPYIYGNDGNRVGGLVGINDGTVKSSFSQVTITGEGVSVGGLVGTNRGTIQDSYTTGSVSGKENIGGLVGLSQGDSNKQAYITNCYSVADVTASGNNAGGLVGYNLGDIFQCYASSQVVGDNCVGGLVGYVYRSGSIEQCAALDSTVSGSGEVGGLVGHLQYRLVTDSFARVLSISGSSFVGSLIGMNYGSDIIRCYATGDLGLSLTSGDDYGATVTSSYSDTGGSGEDARSSEQMKSESTYVDWDFTQVWTIDSGVNGGYPYQIWLEDYLN